MKLASSRSLFSGIKSCRAVLGVALAGAMIQPASAQLAFTASRVDVPDYFGQRTEVRGVNNSLQFVGFAGDLGSNCRGVIWDKTGAFVKFLPVIPGGATRAVAKKINNDGYVVGWAYNGSGSQKGYVYLRGGSLSPTYDLGTFTFNTDSFDINDSELWVGSGQTANNSSDSPWYGVPNSGRTSWKLYELRQSGNRRTGEARGVNASGVVVGWVQDSSDSNRIRAFKVSTNNAAPAGGASTKDVTLLSRGSYHSCRAYGINDAGWVVGIVGTDSSLSNKQIAIWSPGGTLYVIGAVGSEALDISNTNYIVGAYFIGGALYGYIAPLNTGSPTSTPFYLMQDIQPFGGYNFTGPFSINAKIERVSSVTDTAANLALAATGYNLNNGATEGVVCRDLYGSGFNRSGSKATGTVSISNGGPRPGEGVSFNVGINYVDAISADADVRPSEAQVQIRNTEGTFVSNFTVPFGAAGTACPNIYVAPVGLEGETVNFIASFQGYDSATTSLSIRTYGPGISSLAVPTAYYGQYPNGINLGITGGGFYQNRSGNRSRPFFNGSERATNYSNNTFMTINLSAADLAIGSHSISVFNDFGGGWSSPSTFTVAKNSTALTADAINSSRGSQVTARARLLTSNSGDSGRVLVGKVVDFYQGARYLASATTDSQGYAAQLVYLSPSPIANETQLKAVFNGDATANASQGLATITIPNTAPTAGLAGGAFRPIAKPGVFSGNLEMALYGLVAPEQAITLEFWTRLNSVTQGIWAKMFGGATGEGKSVLAQTYGSIDPRTSYFDFGSYVDGSGRLGPNSINNSEFSGAWIHIAFCAANGTMKAYVNGQLYAEKSTSSTWFRQATSLFIGGFNGTDYVNGEMDDVRIWSYAKTQAEIQRLMKVRVPASANGLVSNWRMDDTGRVATDATSLRNGDFVGEPMWVPSGAPIDTVEVVRTVPTSITLPAFDADGDTLSYQIVTAPVVASLTGTGATRTIVYPASGAANDQFTYRVTDSKGAVSNIATVKITVAPTTVAGKIVLPSWQGGSVQATCTVLIAGSETPVLTQAFTILANGDYGINIPLSGVYDLRVKGPKWLSKKIRNVLLTGGTVNAPTTTLLTGDCDDDNVVSIFDYIILSDAFDSAPGSSNWNPLADLDGDSVISIFDYILLSDNFDSQGE